MGQETMLQKLYIHFIYNGILIANKIKKNNPKAFYQYASCKTKSKEYIPDLVKDDRTPTSDGAEKCNSLNKLCFDSRKYIKYA